MLSSPLANNFYSKICNQNLNEEQILAELSTLNKNLLRLQRKERKETLQNILQNMAIRGFTRVLKSLIKDHGADPNLVDSDNQTPLLNAIMYQQEDAAVYLATQTKNYPKDKQYKKTALHHAVSFKKVNVIKAILANAPKDILEEKSIEGFTPLHLAARSGDLGCIKMLIEARADPHLLDNRNRTPLFYAIMNQHQEAAVYLATQTKNYPKDNQYKKTALHHAISLKQGKVIRAILDNAPKSILEEKTEKGFTALHGATLKDDLDCIKSLVNAGADLKSKTNEGTTAYTLSLCRKNLGIISYFLDIPQASSAIQIEYFGIPMSPFKLIFNDDYSTDLSSCIMLLEAGAGLSLKHIPIEGFHSVLMLNEKPKQEDLNKKNKTDLHLIAQHDSSEVIALYHNGIQWCEISKTHEALKEAKIELPHLEIVQPKDIKKIASFYGCTKGIIPVFETLQKQSSAEWECLIAGQHHFEGKKRLKLVTRVDEFLKLLENSEYSFKLNQIAHSAHHPLIANLPHVKKIAQRLESYLESPQKSASNSSASIASGNSFDEHIVISTISQPQLEEFQNLKDQIALKYFQGERDFFCQENDYVLSQFIFIDHLLNNGYDFQSLYLDGILGQFLQGINEILNITYHPSFSHQVDLLAPVSTSFLKLTSTVLYFIENPLFKPPYHLAMLTPFENYLRKVIHIHGNHLEQTKGFIPLHIILLNARITTLFRMIQPHFDIGHLDMARTLVNKVFYISAKIKNPDIEIIQIKTKCSMMLCYIHIHEGRLDTAYNHISQILETINKHDIFFRISKLVRFLIENHTTLSLDNALVLLGETIKYTKSLEKIDESAFEGEKENLLYLQELRTKILNALDAEKASEMASQLALQPIPKLECVVKELESLHIENEAPSTLASSCAPEPVIFTRKKTKTQGKANPALNKKRNKQSSQSTKSESDDKIKKGLTVPKGYMQPITILQNNCKEPHLFMTMPKKHPSFELFYNLILGSCIESIAEGGTNQHGLKLTTFETQDYPGAPHRKIPGARLKVTGTTLRPRGFIEDSYRDANGRVQTLYVFRPDQIVEKKKEERSGYKC